MKKREGHSEGLEFRRGGWQSVGTVTHLLVDALVRNPAGVSSPKTTLGVPLSFFVGDKSAFQDQHEEGRKGHHESKAATILPMYTPEGRPILITIYDVT